jgi:hypothetical protein
MGIDWKWPNAPYASSDAWATEYRGADDFHYGRFYDIATTMGRGDGYYVIEADKVGELGLSYVKFYKLTGDEKYLRAALGCADCLAANVRKAVAERASMALRVALQGGIVPGGGKALLDCQPALSCPAANDSERFARKIPSRALEEPLRVIAANAGFDPGSVVATVRASAPGYGFDALTGQIVNLYEAGIIDAALALQTSMRTAVNGAALVLTTDVLVHHRQPERSTKP